MCYICNMQNGKLSPGYRTQSKHPRFAKVLLKDLAFNNAQLLLV